ncbi:hypothetical protein [Nonomuraea sp. NPDC049129]|uniref:hypothetical protein n=1 Tax=Nonomuraea sp. NPDC049129 TaxID=3155272 RepID=UPI0033D2CE3E
MLTVRQLLDYLTGLPDETPVVVNVNAGDWYLRVEDLNVTTAQDATGDPVEALRVTELGTAADPGLSFAYLGTYQRLAQCWALTLTGDDPAGTTAEAEQIIATDLLDPPRSCVATWFGLLGEMRLARGEPAAAVRSAGEKARELSTARGAHLFARRAETFLAGLG